MAILILVSVVAGTMAYQYYTALDARRSDLHVTGCRLGLMLLEAWKGQGAKTDFDPVGTLALDLVISDSGSTEPPPQLANVLGSYNIIAARANYFATLSYEDPASEPRLLNVTVAWGQRDYGQGTASDTDKSFSWTTYQGY